MKLYQYVKILYVQANCSMFPHVLAWCAPSRLQDRSAEQKESPLTGSCTVLLDCRRLVKHENVPSNFQAATLSMCVCIKLQLINHANVEFFFSLSRSCSN